jgi:hypothetical protein
MAVFTRTVLQQNVNYSINKPTTYQGLNTPSTNSVGLPLIFKENPSNSDLTKAPEIALGVPSFINPYAVLSFPSRYGSNFNTVIDNPDSYSKFSSPMNGVGVSQGSNNIDPSVYNLVNTPPDGSDNGPAGAKTPYRYTDFIYCKYYGIIPNNHLITLRRYPAPTFDNLNIPLMIGEDASSNAAQNDFKPIAQAVTWTGEETGNKISDILGFEVTTNWKLWESAVESVQGNEQDAEQGPKLLQGAAKFLAISSGLAGGNINSANDTANASYDPYANGPYSHRVYGPVNVIEKTYKRDRGLDFKQSFALNFHYSLRSIAGINPKAAMLDIMSNMLALTYNNAAFWGGANRYFPKKPLYPFLGGPGGMNAWYRGNPVAFRNAFMGQTHNVLSQIGDLFSSLKSDPVAALSQLAQNGAKMGMAILSKGMAPDIVSFKSLLTGEPVGEWHMVVGNPYSPTMNIGNLICTGAKFQFNDTLGADNFPTELHVIINLEHGRPRDSGDIQSMFNEGEGRIYFAPADNKEAFNSSSQKNSTNDNSYTNKQKTNSNNTTTPSTTTKSKVQTSRHGKGHQSSANVQSKPNTVNNASAADKATGVGNNTNVQNLASTQSNANLTIGQRMAIQMGLGSAGSTKSTASPQGKA